MMCVIFVFLSLSSWWYGDQLDKVASAVPWLYQEAIEAPKPCSLDNSSKDQNETSLKNTRRLKDMTFITLKFLNNSEKKS